MCLSDYLEQCLLTLTPCVASLLFDTLQLTAAYYAVCYRKLFLKNKKSAVTESPTIELQGVTVECVTNVALDCCD